LLTPWISTRRQQPDIFQRIFHFNLRQLQVVGSLQIQPILPGLPKGRAYAQGQFGGDRSVTFQHLGLTLSANFLVVVMMATLLLLLLAVSISKF
jgi:hypothetical protein